MDGITEGTVSAFEQPLKSRHEFHAAHGSGHPGKIESEPELQAFIPARNYRLTFAQIVTYIRPTFPPDRSCNRSRQTAGNWHILDTNVSNHLKWGYQTL